MEAINVTRILRRTQVGHIRQEVERIQRRLRLLVEKPEEKCITWCMPEERLETYQTESDTPAKHTTSRKSMQDGNYALEPRHELSIVSSKVTESLCLLLNDVDDGVDRFAIHELVDDLMSGYVGTCSLLEFIQGSLKE